MLFYTRMYGDLKAIYDPLADKIDIPGSAVSIRNVKFESTMDDHFFSAQKDAGIGENNDFSYPVFVPGDTSSQKVILLFHGLNERSWDKYLTWAFFLAKSTGSYVVLFPISFHINRTPDSWRDPRASFMCYNSRRVDLGDIEKSSLANVMLSRRLSETPLRFFSSGYQTAVDVCGLVESIKKGSHSIIPQSNKVDIFAYSIGAFMAQILMMANPKGLFNGSKLFIFCGGSVFSNMRGTSKYIMDKVAYDKVYKFYVNDFENKIKRGYSLYDFFNNNTLGLTFRSMLSLTRGKEYREKALKRLAGDIYAIALEKDTVIPPNGIIDTLSVGPINKPKVKVIDFPFSYCHEAPFPVLKTGMSDQVDICFNMVFDEAATFLGRFPA